MTWHPSNAECFQPVMIRKGWTFYSCGNHSRRKLLYYLLTYSPPVNINAFKKQLQVGGREALKNQAMKNWKFKVTDWSCGQQERNMCLTRRKIFSHPVVNFKFWNSGNENDVFKLKSWHQMPFCKWGIVKKATAIFNLIISQNKGHCDIVKR